MTCDGLTRHGQLGVCQRHHCEAEGSRCPQVERIIPPMDDDLTRRHFHAVNVDGALLSIGVPDGRGRGTERTVRANSTTDRQTATTTGRIVGLTERMRHHHHGRSASEWRRKEPNRWIKRSVWTVDAAEAPRKLRGSPMASPQPGWMVGFAPFRGFIRGMPE